MNVKEFKEDYDGASISLEDFAYAASTVTDYGRLAYAANEFLRAKFKFEKELDDIGVELGWC